TSALGGALPRRFALADCAATSRGRAVTSMTAPTSIARRQTLQAMVLIVVRVFMRFPLIVDSHIAGCLSGPPLLEIIIWSAPLPPRPHSGRRRSSRLAPQDARVARACVARNGPRQIAAARRESCSSNGRERLPDRRQERPVRGRAHWLGWLHAPRVRSLRRGPLR